MLTRGQLAGKIRELGKTRGGFRFLPEKAFPNIKPEKLPGSACRNGGQSKMESGVNGCWNSHQLIYLSFLNEDGIGSSRILLNVELGKQFPKGYYLALPDRSCGLAISKDITDVELKEVQLLVAEMFENATTPMTREIFNIEDFTLPAKWSEPMDKDFLGRISDAIIRRFR